MNELWRRIRTWYAGLDASQRRRFWTTLAVAVAGTVVVSIWAGSASWRPVVAAGSWDDTVAASAALEEIGIPYKVRGDGRLDVPASQLGRARSAVAGTRSLPGLSDVDGLKLGLTPTAQEWALIRAREGDLAAMINEIDGVNWSRVTIVPRTDALFLDEERPATASVLVRMRPGMELNSSQVRAVASMVARSVDGLHADRVTILDDRGTLLADGEKNDAGSPNDHFEYRSQLERRYERAVMQSLLPVLGDPSALSVTASVDLDLSSSETVTKQVSIDQQAVLSEQVQESLDDRSTPRGVPGVDANLPERTEPARSSEQKSEKSAIVTNYIYPTIDEIKRRPAGGVTRLSVGVQVDDARLSAMLGADAPAEERALLEKRISDAVHSAVGFDATRGDVVTVGFLPFAPMASAPPATGFLPVSVAPESVLPWAVALVAVVLAFLTVVRPMVNAATRPAPARPTAAPVAAKAEDDDDLADRLVELVDSYKPVDATLLNKLVEQESMAAAQVVRRWNKR